MVVWGGDGDELYMVMRDLIEVIQMVSLWVIVMAA